MAARKESGASQKERGAEGEKEPRSQERFGVLRRWCVADTMDND
jgi:hypothetical protein